MTLLELDLNRDELRFLIDAAEMGLLELMDDESRANRIAANNLYSKLLKIAEALEANA